jgi:hypothetical protein
MPGKTAMETKTECQKLADRFDRMAADDGLWGVKFYVSGEAALEQVCAEVNAMYEAVDMGEFVALDFKDSNRK